VVTAPGFGYDAARTAVAGGRGWVPLVGSLGVAIPLGLRLAFGERANERLDSWRWSLVTHGAGVTTALLVAFGTVLIVRGGAVLIVRGGAVLIVRGAAG
jgi:hypothetical protein